jgi:hypothetical protein
MGSGCIDQCFLDLGTSCRLMVSFKPRPHYFRWLGGHRGLSGRRGEGKISLSYKDGTPTPRSSSALPICSPLIRAAFFSEWIKELRGYWMQVQDVSFIIACSVRINVCTERGGAAITVWISVLALYDPDPQSVSNSSQIFKWVNNVYWFWDDGILV